MKYALALFVGIMCALPATESLAASCSALKSELRRLQSAQGDTSPAARKWQSQKRQQQKALSAAERDARHFGCTNSNSGECRSLNSKIKRMRSNLSAIERQLQKSSRGGAQGNRARISQVRKQIRQQSCDRPRTEQAANRQDRAGQRQSAPSRSASLAPAENQGANGRGFFQRLFSMRPDNQPVSVKPVPSNGAASRTNRKQSGGASGAYTSICVRTCDGYFFPLSRSVSKNRFADDEARCTEMCPAAPMELYVFRRSREEPAQMKSLAGQFYTEQPFAFRFRQEYVEGCSCRALSPAQRQSGLTEVSAGGSGRIFLNDISAGISGVSLRAQQHEIGPADETSPLARQPVGPAKLPAHLDPDTMFNMEQGFNVTADLSKMRYRIKGDGALLVSNERASGSLPFLASRNSATNTDNEPREEDTGPPPVFLTEQSGFAAQTEEKSVRVVGPEFFVSQ